jgi:asparagine synthase (glutamine-hydrolysing)
LSGFAAGTGNPEKKMIDVMMDKVRHRGPWKSGIHEGSTVIAGQNYLRADAGGSSADGDPAAAALPISEDGLVICYDGQIGNLPGLAKEAGVAPGPFREERTLLALYRAHGREMLSRLDDAIFSFIIFDGNKILAARDLLGIKTLFYGKKDHTLYLSSELKSLIAVTGDVNEFPPGHSMDETGTLARYAGLPSSPPPRTKDDPEQMAENIRDIILRSVKNRIDFSVPTAGLLSGGMDSSVINTLASELLKELKGPDAVLKTFSIGVGESSTDIENARLMAGHLGTEHEELIVGVKELVDALPEVIYYLESFDPSLVRSSVANYLISRKAAEQGYEILLSGEGGDEVFCGYIYLKQFPGEELFTRQMECIEFLHNNASLRLDRMNQASSIRVVAPLISGELLRYAMTIPPEYKQRPGTGTEEGTKVEKWIFRKAYENMLPKTITGRIKQEFSQGSGSAGALPAYFEGLISDNELVKARERFPIIRSKEELYYFKLFTETFGEGKAVQTVGQWVSL